MPGEGALMNGSTKAPGSRQHRTKMAAFVVDRARIEIAYLADRLRQSAERRHLRLAGMLLQPHSLEFGIALDVRTRRALPVAAEAGKPGLEIEKESAAARRFCRRSPLRTALHDRSHRLAAVRSISATSTSSPRARKRIEPRQLARPRQATGMGQNFPCSAAWRRPRCARQLTMPRPIQDDAKQMNMSRGTDAKRLRSDLPSQMLLRTNRLMPIGGEICPSSIKMKNHANRIHRDWYSTPERAAAR